MKPEERAAVIEECAKVCEALRNRWADGLPDERPSWSDAARKISFAIRALTAQSPAGVPPEPDSGGLLDVTRVFRAMQSAGCEGWTHEDGWTLMATADINALAEDARRYQWLRQQNWNDSELSVVARPKDAVKLGHECPTLDRLDAAIDRARAAGVPTTEPVAPIARETLIARVRDYFNRTMNTEAHLALFRDVMAAIAAPQAPAEPVAQEPVLDKLKAALAGCRHCDYDEAEGELFRHCAACQLKTTQAAWDFVHTATPVVAQVASLVKAGNMLFERVDHIGCANCWIQRVATNPTGKQCVACAEAIAAWEAATASPISLPVEVARDETINLVIDLCHALEAHMYPLVDGEAQGDRVQHKAINQRALEWIGKYVRG
jgi:hypothetical protein